MSDIKYDANLIFKKLKRAIDVYHVYKDRSGAYVEKNIDYVSKEVVQSELSSGEKVAVIDSDEYVIANNFLN